MDAQLPRVLAVILALHLPPAKAIESLLNQKKVNTTVVVVAGFASALKGLSNKVTKILHTPDMRLHTGVRVAKALNASLGLFDLTCFDYVLKADDDVLFPPSFLRQNIEAGFDLMGRGCGLLIRTEPFIKFMGGRFKEICADDVYLLKCFSANELRVLPWRWVYPAHIFRQPHYSWKRMYEVGKDYYRMGSFLGFFIFHLLNSLVNRGPMHMFLALGYFAAILERESQYPIANKVRQYELHLSEKMLSKYLWSSKRRR